MNKQFGRRIELIVGGKTLRSEDLQIHFDVPFDDKPEANESKVIIYNLSDSTINAISVYAKVVLNAGYEGAVGTILEGYIYDHDTRWQDVDKETTFYVHDSSDPRTKALGSVSYGKNAKADTIIRDIAKRASLPVAMLKLPKNAMYARGRNVSGVSLEIIRDIAQDCGAQAYILKGKLYVRPIADTGNETITVSGDSGLMGSPDYFTDEGDRGYDFKKTLDHRIEPKTIINLQGKDAKARLRVRKGRHVANESEFLTEVEGVYFG